jgi:hypothetical protein
MGVPDHQIHERCKKVLTVKPYITLYFHGKSVDRGLNIYYIDVMEEPTMEKDLIIIALIVIVMVFSFLLNSKKEK